MFLPPEILQLIFGDLSKRDLKSYRLACKAWNNQVPQLLFNSVFISPRYADLEVADSVASAYGSFVRTLTYCLEYPEQYHQQWVYARYNARTEEENDPGIEEQSYFEHRVLENQKISKQFQEEYREIFLQKMVFKQLLRAFTSMPQISVVKITGSWRKRDKCWWAQAVTDATNRSYKPLEGVEPCSNGDCGSPYYHQGRCDVFFVPHWFSDPAQSKGWWKDLMEALHESGKTVQAILVDSPDDKYASLPAEIWAPSPHVESIMLNIFSALTKLQLCLNDPGERAEEPRESKAISRFLSSAVNLEYVHISLAITTRESAASPAGGTLFQALFRGCSFPKLSTLSLERCTANTDEIMLFVKKSPNLRSLVFKRFTLVGGYWVPLVQEIRDTTKVTDLQIDWIRGSMAEPGDDESAYIDIEAKLMEIFHSERGSLVTYKDLTEIVE